MFVVDLWCFLAVLHSPDKHVELIHLVGDQGEACVHVAEGVFVCVRSGQQTLETAVELKEGMHGFVIPESQPLELWRIQESCANIIEMTQNLSAWWPPISDGHVLGPKSGYQVTDDVLIYDRLGDVLHDHRVRVNDDGKHKIEHEKEKNSNRNQFCNSIS